MKHTGMNRNIIIYLLRWRNIIGPCDLEVSPVLRDLTTDQEEASDEVRRVKEVVDGVSDEDIKSAMEMIKTARETDNSAQGLISSNTDFRSSNPETFLFDSGASVSIMGEKMARENKLTIRRLSKPRNVHEASGAKLDIIRTADMSHPGGE